MAAVQGQIGEMDNFIDKRRALLANTGKPVTVLTTSANFNDRNALEARLISAGYTQATINSMSMNDCMYAVRLVAEAAGVN